MRRWYVVADDVGPGPEWAVPYEDVAGSGAAAPPVARSGDDLLLLYTGGTTGIPKGVMWRQDDLFNVLGAGGNPFAGTGPAGDTDEVASRAASADPPPVMVVACPLMHGTGQFSALIAMTGGGTVVSLAGRHFDVAELFDTVERHRASNIVIVGQAFAGPMLAHLDASPGRHDLSSVAVISSSGVMWSHENKQGLLRHMPQAVLFDSFGSSEAVGLGASVSAAGTAEETARFAITENNAVFTDDGRRVEPGSSEIGMIAVGGYLPVGYYKDDAKTAATFREVEGRRWSIPGDFASVNADGTIHLLGRGSVCINTGGEKVFPEEVEEALKTHAAVRDAVVVGIPDDRFGEIDRRRRRTGRRSVGRTPTSSAPTSAAASPRTRRLAGSCSSTRSDGRANGKVDYKRIKAEAMAIVAGSA